MLMERLKYYYDFNEPIFTREILQVMSEYSRQRVYQMISDAEEKGLLVRYDIGIYYIPLITEFGQSVPSINNVIDKKYIKNKDETFGIYGKDIIALNFMLSYQVPNVIEVITNKESRKVREVEIRGQKIILRKSRLPITSSNENTYILLELFTHIDINKYNENKSVRDCISKFIDEKRITKSDILNIADAFPAKTMKNIAMTGVLYEVAQ